MSAAAEVEGLDDGALDLLWRAMGQDGGWWGAPKLVAWATTHGLAPDEGERLVGLLVLEGEAERQGESVPRWRVRLQGRR